MIAAGLIGSQNCEVCRHSKIGKNGDLAGRTCCGHELVTGGNYRPCVIVFNWCKGAHFEAPGLENDY